MLKLENKRCSKGPTISIKTRASFFNPLLLKALAIALAAHLLALVLFSTRTFQEVDIVILPPANVVTDPSIHTTYASLNTARVDSHGFLTHSLDKPEKSAPYIPAAPKKLREAAIPSTTPVIPADMPIDSLGHRISLSFDEVAAPNPMIPTRLQIHFAGGLSGCSIKERCVKKLQHILRNMTMTVPITLQYAASLEERSGKIYEWELISASSEEIAQAKRDELISALRIETPKGGIRTRALDKNTRDFEIYSEGKSRKTIPEKKSTKDAIEMGQFDRELIQSSRFLVDGIIEITILIEEDPENAPHVLLGGEVL